MAAPEKTETVLLYETLNSLKASVKSECQRRQYTGSVTSYAGTGYDYTNTPTAGNVAAKEHYEKIAVPMNAISGDIDVNAVRVISETELTTLNTKIKTLAAIDMTVAQANTGCAASCTGLCSTGCATGCTGCSGCSGCGGSCSYDCTGCSGCSGCGGSCSYGCTNCANNCSYGCGGSCGDSCAYNCSGGCRQSCTGCTGSCDGSCWSSAAGGGTCGALCTAMCASSSTN